MVGSVLITGGSSGIGLETAKILSSDFNVIICARNEQRLREAQETLEQKATHKVYMYVADVGVEHEVEKLFQVLSKEHGVLTACVNNAGLLTPASVVNTSLTLWNMHVAANMTSVFLCSKFAFELMKKQDNGGCIVNVSSLAGIRGVQKFPNMSAYIASKHGVVGLTEAFAVEGKPHAIHVNCVAPGSVDTQMYRQLGFGKARHTPKDIASVIASFCKKNEHGKYTGTIYEACHHV